MGMMSVVSGYIVAWEERSMEHNRRAIAAYPFDDDFPFTNIFWCDSPARYFFPVIGFTGAYHSIEIAWSEWLWKFSQLLTTLEALEAHVSLHGMLGSFAWELRPKASCPPMRQVATFVGEPWVITKAPPNDFSIDPDWLAQSTNRSYDPASEASHIRQWDRFVERLILKPL